MWRNWLLIALGSLCLVTGPAVTGARQVNNDSGESPSGKCGNPPVLENGIFRISDDGDWASYACNSGYTRFGERTVIKCKDNGKWSSLEIVCSAPGCSADDNSTVRFARVDKYNSGNVLLYSCYAGYQLQRGAGNPLVYCDGERWRNQRPVCVRQTESAVGKCGPPPRVANAMMSKDVQRAVITYTCLSGYTQRLGRKIRCTTAGQWSGTLPACTRLGCDIPHVYAVTNGIVNRKAEGSILEIDCNFGFELRGSPKLFCDGRSWNGSLPACVSVQRSPVGYPSVVVDGDRCPNPVPGVPNARITAYLRKFDAYRNLFYAIEYQCNEGFVMESDYAVYCSRSTVMGIRPICVALPATCLSSNGGCMQLCRNTREGAVCSCRHGYHLAQDGKRCQDIDECGQSADGLADCQAGCQNTIGSYRCYCPGNWHSLANDGKSCLDVACNCGSGTSSCSWREGQKVCTCKIGYTLAQNGLSCADRNECQESAPCDRRCINTQGSYRCSCPESGYQLAANGHSCEDINECRITALNQCKHECINTPGGYHCACQPGHFMMPDGISCQGCRPNSYRSDTANECLECPAHSRTDGRAKASIDDCLCLSGFSRADNSDDDVLCKDIDECAEDNGGCSNGCINTPGSFYCSCPIGYSLMEDRRTCFDHDECAQSNGGCEHQCRNTKGSFECLCNDGYTVSTADSYRCADVDECMTYSHGCEKLCINFAGGFHCACDGLSLLQADGKTCSPVNCSPLVLQENMQVSPKDRCLGRVASITADTTCTMSCQSGYELHGLAERKCLSTGQWSDQSSLCRPVQCSNLDNPLNGQVHPPSCLSPDGNEFKSACVYSCEEGYALIGNSFTSCEVSGRWSDEAPVCVEVSEIACPPDVFISLQPGESHAVLDLPEPEHTLDRTEVVGAPVGNNFPAGRTTVTYRAYSDTSSATASCSFDVHVDDDESPTVDFCPDSFTVNTAETYPQIDVPVPVVTDNVGVVDKSTIITPEGRFTWGVYTVLTESSDAAGNTAICHFTISIRTVECGSVVGPLNGINGCSDWMMGRICEPRCNGSHAFLGGLLADLYLCGADGQWHPSSAVPDCSPYEILGDQDSCPVGTELKTHDVTVEQICIACPRGMYGTTVDSVPRCVPCGVGTYQEMFGQTSCRACPNGETTAGEGAVTAGECSAREDTMETVTEATGATTFQFGDSTWPAN